jgi:hypothetical protein
VQFRTTGGDTEDGKVKRRIGREAGGASRKSRNDKGSTKNAEKHQWWDADRKDETHQRQHPVTSAS